MWWARRDSNSLSSGYEPGAYTRFKLLALKLTVIGIEGTVVFLGIIVGVFISGIIVHVYSY
jgi:hypothetical protein